MRRARQFAWNRRMSFTTNGAEISARERHLAAVVGSFRSAEDAAARGDYVDALLWVDVIEAVGDAIPPEYQVKRDAWSAALTNQTGSDRSRRSARFVT
jgi:hypothetical protein